MTSELETYREILLRSLPELQTAKLTLLNAGWDSVAVDADSRLIFKFPRDAKAEAALVREHAVLERVRPVLSMRVPKMKLHEASRLFSEHDKIPGEHLLPADYARLPEANRQRVAAQMGEFYAQLHAIDPRVWEGLPQARSEPQPSAEEIARDLEPFLPDDLRKFADDTLAAWRSLPPDPYGEIYGFYDGHGWNMAFDHEVGVLNGVFDFADSDFGPLQDEFIYSNFISRDLTERIIGVYEAHSGRAIDWQRVELLTGVLLLSELAGSDAYPEKRPQCVERLQDWALQVRSRS